MTEEPIATAQAVRPDVYRLVVMANQLSKAFVDNFPTTGGQERYAVAAYQEILRHLMNQEERKGDREHFGELMKAAQSEIAELYNQWETRRAADLESRWKNLEEQDQLQLVLLRHAVASQGLDKKGKKPTGLPPEVKAAIEELDRRAELSRQLDRAGEGLSEPADVKAKTEEPSHDEASPS